MNIVMEDGKKWNAEKILYGALDVVAQKTQKADPVGCEDVHHRNLTRRLIVEDDASGARRHAQAQGLGRPSALRKPTLEL